jgi:stage V sporulation protein AD
VRAAPALLAAVEQKGQGAWRLASPPYLAGSYTVAGPDEAKGPLGGAFDEEVQDPIWGESSFERAERKFLTRAMEGALDRTGWAPGDVDVALGGDLLDQLVSHSFAVRERPWPFLGLFSACATCGEGLALGATLVAAGAVRRAMASVCSHYHTAERQFRYPTELGVQRLPTSQHTATGAVAFLLSREEVAYRGAGARSGGPVRVSGVTVGRVRDLGVRDVNNMGGAEAAAAADTVLRHLRLHGSSPQDYDLVLSGDLGRVGLPLAQELCQRQGVDMASRWEDAGLLLYGDRKGVDSGGSGAACCALVLAAHALPRLAQGELGRVLLVATGSLHSKTSYQQGESIPVVAHAVELQGPSARPWGEGGR